MDGHCWGSVTKKNLFVYALAFEKVYLRSFHDLSVFSGLFVRVNRESGQERTENTEEHSSSPGFHETSELKNGVSCSGL